MIIEGNVQSARIGDLFQCAIPGSLFGTRDEKPSHNRHNQIENPAGNKPFFVTSCD